MMIADVIREAGSKHEIYFLLTAYIEAVQYGNKLNNLSEGMTDLPLTGVQDVRTRFNRLSLELGNPRSELRDHDRRVAREASHVLQAALFRLRLLEDTEKASASSREIALA